MKKCCRCGEIKPLSGFCKDKSRLDGHEYRCKQCKKKKQKIYYKEHREELLKYSLKYRKEHPNKKSRKCTRTRREYSLFSNYGITSKEYKCLFEKQNGKCAICQKTSEENGRNLCVDHDHETNRIRGLLCHACNSAIGFLQDNPKLCEQAKLYLLK